MRVNGEAVYDEHLDGWSKTNRDIEFAESGRFIAESEVEVPDTRRRDDQYNYIFVDSASVGEIDLGCRSDKLIGRPILLGNLKRPRTTIKDCRVVIHLTKEDLIGPRAIKVIRIRRRIDKIV